MLRRGRHEEVQYQVGPTDHSNGGGEGGAERSTGVELAVENFIYSKSQTEKMRVFNAKILRPHIEVQAKSKCLRCSFQRPGYKKSA